MRTHAPILSLAPLLLLTIACADQVVTAPHDASFATTSGDATADYDALALGGHGAATAINDAGIIVGYTRPTKNNGNDPYVAYRWVASSTGVAGPEALGILPPPYQHAPMQVPHAINSSGMIVGHFRSNAIPNSHGSYSYGAFAYRDDQMLVLPHFGGDTYEWTAADVNDHGISVGSIRYAVRDDNGSVVEQLNRGAVWFNTEDEPVLLPPLDGHTASSAGGINNDGLITGRSMPARWDAGVGVAWRVDGGEVQEGPYPIEVSGKVNNAGDIIGWSADGPALMRNGIVLPLRSLDPDESCGVEGLSDVADGVVRVVGVCGSRAALWTVTATNAVGGPVDLGVPSNNSTWPRAAGVNRSGWIVGTTTTNRQGPTPTVWLPRGSSEEECKPHPKHADRCR